MSQTTVPYIPTVTDHEDVRKAMNANAEDAEVRLSGLEVHRDSHYNPHNVTKDQVGLGNVDNTSDKDKPISDDTQQALDGKADVGHNHDSDYFKKDEFIETSSGSGDAGKPIILN